MHPYIFRCSDDDVFTIDRSRPRARKQTSLTFPIHSLRVADCGVHARRAEGVLERSGPKQPREAKLSATMDYGQVRALELFNYVGKSQSCMMDYGQADRKRVGISSELILSGAVSQVVTINATTGAFPYNP